MIWLISAGQIMISMRIFSKKLRVLHRFLFY